MPHIDKTRALIEGFGTAMSRGRETAGWSQRQFAERLAEQPWELKLDSSAISRMEKGEREPRLREAIVIATVLDFPLDLSFGRMIGGEAQFADGEKGVKDRLSESRNKLLQMGIELHIASDGIFSDEEEAEILARRGVSSMQEWAEKIADELATRFRVEHREDGAINYVQVESVEHLQLLQTLVGSIFAGLFRPEWGMRHSDSPPEVQRLADSIDQAILEPVEVRFQ